MSRKAAGASARRSPNGPAAFHAWYGAMHGERWPALAEACAQAARHFALSAGLSRSYFLDPASVLAALALDIRPGQAVLDLCAAPGGKTLVIAQRLFGLVPPEPRLAELGGLASPGLPASDAETADGPAGDGAAADAETEPAGMAEPAEGGLLVANERSATRRGRLRQVLANHLPAWTAARLRVTGFDAGAWGQHEQSRYDRILLDVPCSSERHLIADPRYLEEWSAKRSEQLAQQAYAMGLSAGRALKPGGFLLYCTCALSERENDEAVERICERSAAQAKRYAYRLEPRSETGLAPRLDELAGMAGRDLSGGLETTRFGLRIWPDRAAGFGPLYFARIEKVACP